MPIHEDKRFEGVLSSKHDGTCTGKFHSDGDTLTEIWFLNRLIRWDPATGRAEFARLIRGTSQWCFEFCDWKKSSLVVTPVARRPKSEELLLLAEAKSLNAEDTTLYRSVTMRVNCLSLDRSDLSSAAGSLARGMQSPTTKNLEELKRVGRYLRGRPVGAIVFEPQILPGVLEVFCDADHAGDLGTRKSRFGMAVVRRSALDQARECSAEHHHTDLYGILRVTQVVGSCARNQSHVGRLTLRGGMRDSHALRQQCCKEHVCSTRTVGNSTC